eukprot:TRINITY_DN19577_c0_g1_i1.p1 TRINITY_DN19577_c0_g1~~TRINITY_DN19577_c0_g1_i1.p1  ORF type:complete len:223 (+),score=53.71 TRINITY_DN19577_c0_g1_i1:43-711(+)
MSSLAEEGGGSCYFEGGDMVSVMRTLSLRSKKEKTAKESTNTQFDEEEVESEEENSSESGEGNITNNDDDNDDECYDKESGGGSCYCDGANMVEVIRSLSGKNLKTETVAPTEPLPPRHAWSTSCDCEDLTTIDECRSANVIQCAWRRHHPSDAAQKHTRSHKHESPSPPSPGIGLLTRNGSAVLKVKGEVLITEDEEKAILKMQRSLRRWLQASRARASTT